MSDIQPITIYDDTGGSLTLLTKFVGVSETGTTTYEIVTTSGHREIVSGKGLMTDNQGRKIVKIIVFGFLKIAEDKVFAVVDNDAVYIGTTTKP